MKFSPSPEQEKHAITHDEGTPYDLNDAALAVSGSKWSVIHLKALRVYLYDGLPLSYLFPSEYLPSENHIGEPENNIIHEQSAYTNSI